MPRTRFSLAGLAIVGEYLLNAAGKEVTNGIRELPVSVLLCLLDQWCSRQDRLILEIGLFKIVIVIFISITGWAALGGGIKKDDFHSTETPQCL